MMCAVTALVDFHRPRGGTRSALVYPEMGVYSCFLSYSMELPRPSYFTIPQFIYFQSLQLVFLLINVVLFIYVSRIILSRNTEDLGIQPDEKKRRVKENFWIVLKMFFILVAAWICEMLTTALEAEYGSADTCWARLVFDSFNLFYGVAFFIVLVCTSSKLGALRTKVSSWSSLARESLSWGSESRSRWH